MTNEEIVEESSNSGKEFVNMYDMMELARQDEREKMQGVDVWVSWDNNNSTVAPEVWITRPRPNMNGTFTGRVHHDAISSELSISPGQCKKFRIVEVLP